MLVFWPWMGMRAGVCEGVSLARRVYLRVCWYGLPVGEGCLCVDGLGYMRVGCVMGMKACCKCRRVSVKV